MISLIIPAYNEEKNIGRTLAAYAQELSGRPYEIIVVADGQDNTAKIARKAKGNIRVLESKTRLGKGGALRKGLAAAQGEWLGFVDADPALPPREFLKLLQEAQRGRADAAIASRSLPPSKLHDAPAWWRNTTSRGFNFLVNLLFGLGIRDTQCGGKVFRARKLRPILPQLILTGFAIDVELLWKLKRRGAKISEVPVEYYYQKGSKVGWKNIFGMAWELVKLRIGNCSGCASVWLGLSTGKVNLLFALP